MLLLSIGYLLILAWTAFAMWRNSSAYQKAHLALASYAAIILAGGAAFGFVASWGISFNLVTQVLPFLLIGLGVDDSFIIIGSPPPPLVPQLPDSACCSRHASQHLPPPSFFG